MADIMTFQNIDLSSWNILYSVHIFCGLFKDALIIETAYRRILRCLVENELESIWKEAILALKL
jgi:hypothetical protein